MTPDVFKTQGYAVFPNAVPSEELAMLQDVCDTLLAEPPDDGGHGLHNIGKGEARRFLRHRHADFATLRDFVLGKTAAGILSQCQAGPHFLFNEQFVVKGAGKGASFAWHQDGAYVGFDHKPYVSLWIAIDDATSANGCVSLLPRDLNAQPGIDPHETLEGSDELNGYFGTDPGIEMTCNAGTIVAFSSLTLHRSGENTTDQSRRAYLAQYSVEPIRDPATGTLKRFATPVAE